MKTKVFEGFRVQTKGDTEENLKKAINFIPLEREMIVVLPNEECNYVRFRLGDGKTNVNNLPDINVQADWNQIDPSQPDFIKNKPQNMDGGLTEEDVKKIIQEELENIEIDGGLTKEEVEKIVNEQTANNITEDEAKEIVTTETEGKFTPSPEKLSKDNNANAYTIAVRRSDGQWRYKDLSGLQTNQGQIPVRSTGGSLLIGEISADNHATSKKYVDDLIAPIADHEKRIENLESVLLTYVEDTASAYEKSVPVDVAPNAILDIIGGSSYASTNFFNPEKFDRPHIINEDGSFYLNGEATYEPYDVNAEITLEPRTWYWLCEGEDIPFIEIHGPEVESITTSPFTITYTQKVWFTFRYTAGIHNSPLYFMLSQTENAPYEPYFEGLRNAPVTEIKSCGANLFNPQWLVDYAITNATKIEYKDEVLKVSSYPIKTNITFAKFLEFTGLKVGDKFSAKHIVYDENGAIMPNGTYNITFEGGGDGTWLDIINQGGKTITITEDMLKYQNLNIYMSNASNSPRYVKNIMLVKGGSQAEYKPYSAEPINIINISPELIEACGENYGKAYTYIDFDNKQFVDEGDTLVFTGDENFRYYYYNGNGIDVANICKNGKDNVSNFISTEGNKSGSGYGAGNMWCGYQKGTGFHWIGILDILGFTNDWVDKAKPTNEEKANALAKFKQYVKDRYNSGNPITVRYEILNPVITDISAYLTDYDDFKDFKVQAGGTIIPENPYKYAVPTTLTYVKRRT